MSSGQDLVSSPEVSWLLPPNPPNSDLEAAGLAGRALEPLSGSRPVTVLAVYGMPVYSDSLEVLPRSLANCYADVYVWFCDTGDGSVGVSLCPGCS